MKSPATEPNAPKDSGGPNDSGSTGDSGSAGPTLAFVHAEPATLVGPGHLVELAAVRIVDGDAEDTFHELVRPLVPIDPEASATHGIGDEDVRNARLTHEVLADWFAWLGDAWLVGHGAGATHDPLDLLGFEIARHRIEPPDLPTVDSRSLAQRALDDVSGYDLESLIEELEIEVDVAHRGLGRAVAVWQVVEISLDRLGHAEASGGTALLNAGATIQSLAAAPAPPHWKPTRRRKLERAALTASPVRLHYGAEGAPAARLEVIPGVLFLDKERGYLEAECVRSGTLKTYRLDRIHRVEPIAT